MDMELTNMLPATPPQQKQQFHMPHPSQLQQLQPQSQPLMSEQTAMLLETLPINDMRALHAQALREAEAKRTELRLVLSSRYRDLVGSSDEVLKMEHISQELLATLKLLPEMIQGLHDDMENSKISSEFIAPLASSSTHKNEAKDDENNEELIQAIRQKLSHLTRLTHRHIDETSPRLAAKTLIKLFTLIKSQSSLHDLANKLGKPTPLPLLDDVLMQAQMRMTYLHVEHIPKEISHLSLQILEQKQAKPSIIDSRGALSALALLDTQDPNTLSTRLLDMYYNAKAKLIARYVEELKEEKEYEEQTTKMITIVQLFQYDIFLHSYELFVLNKNKELPVMEEYIVRNKCSQFLANHVPFVRNRLKQTLISISVNADKLGTIRQALYDETNSVTTNEYWDKTLYSLVDLRVLSSGSILSNANLTKNSQMQVTSFNLWSVFFSSTFSSLVHDILTTSFMNVHSGIIETLHRSLANAPLSVLPHEAYRNTHYLVKQLDLSLLKLSNDAHSLLIHAEERQESLLRLQQSLYVQTSEIMGRLLSELRRRMMPQQKVMLVIGRFAFLMKFKLSILPTLLTHNASQGRITLSDLKSSFEIADVDDDGILSLEEAMEAMSMALSGTTSNGVQMLRSALLLEDDVVNQDHVNLTFLELSLLCAKGLKHEEHGKELSAFSMIQMSLNSIVTKCFTSWAQMILEEKENLLLDQMESWLQASSKATNTPEKYMVSSHVIGYLLNVATTLNNNVCPADSLVSETDQDSQNLATVLRDALLLQSLQTLHDACDKAMTGKKDYEVPSYTFVQLLLDIQFVQYCFFERNRSIPEKCKEFTTRYDELVSKAKSRISSEESNIITNQDIISILPSYDLYLTCLFGESKEQISETASSQNAPSVLTPIASTKRFVLMPVQEANRQLMELQVKKDYKKDDGAASAPSSTDGNSGWFMSMLKKK